MGTILECRELTKRFGTLEAVSGLNIKIGTGRIVGLLGPNGSGKTTFLKMLNGLLTPTAGEIIIGGHAPGIETKKIVSYLPDRTYFDEQMKVKDCFKMFADFYGDFNPAKAADMLASLDIDAGRTFRTLSKGTKEKVQLVLVMSRNAKLYLLDEPIGGVDPAARDYILDTIIRNYSEDGTVIISTHLISDIEKILDDVVFLMNGRIERMATVDDIREQTHKSVNDLFKEVFKC